MPSTITQHEMQRRQAIARATQLLTEMMAECDPLTPCEWLRVLETIQARMLAEALAKEWKGE